jgi:hypothetical protein
LTQGHYIQWLDADDILALDKISMQPEYNLRFSSFVHITSIFFDRNTLISEVMSGRIRVPELLGATSL